VDLRNIGETIILIAAVIAAVGVIVAKGIIAPMRFAQRIERAMSRVEHELGNNGGGTLRDRVDAICREQRDLAEQADLRHRAIEDRLVNLEQTLLPKPVRRKSVATSKETR
jgi:hypothetical protein